MPVAVTSDKRFRRAHVSPARRRSWRDAGFRVARIVTACLVVVGVVYYAAGLALSASTLTVSRIEVSGNSRMSRGEVLAVLDGVRGANMLTIDLETWRQKLLHSPWVADAAMRRVFPGTVAVAISERRPMAIGRIQGHLYLIDSRGTVIDEYGPNYAELDLPIVDGLARQSDGMLIDEARAALVGRMLADLQQRPSLAKRVSQIDVSDARDAIVLLERDGALVRLGDERFLDRLQAYIDLAPALRERVPDIDYVDLRFDERVYVRPLGQKATLIRPDTDKTPARATTSRRAQRPAPARSGGGRTRAKG